MSNQFLGERIQWQFQRGRYKGTQLGRRALPQRVQPVRGAQERSACADSATRAGVLERRPPQKSGRANSREELRSPRPTNSGLVDVWRQSPQRLIAREAVRSLQ